MWRQIVFLRHNKSLTQNSRQGKRTTDRQAIIPRLHDCSERSCHVLGSIDLSCECQDVAGGQESSRNSTIPEKTSTSTTRGAEQEGREIQNNIVLNCQTFDLQLDQKFVSNKIDSIIIYIKKKYCFLHENLLAWTNEKFTRTVSNFRGKVQPILGESGV